MTLIPVAMEAGMLPTPGMMLAACRPTPKFFPVVLLAASTRPLIALSIVPGPVDGTPIVAGLSPLGAGLAPPAATSPPPTFSSPGRAPRCMAKRAASWSVMIGPTPPAPPLDELLNRGDVRWRHLLCVEVEQGIRPQREMPARETRSDRRHLFWSETRAWTPDDGSTGRHLLRITTEVGRKSARWCGHHHATFSAPRVGRPSRTITVTIGPRSFRTPPRGAETARDPDPVIPRLQAIRYPRSGACHRADRLLCAPAGLRALTAERPFVFAIQPQTRIC